jgi:membrane protease YdiL (CAAX protease family)
VLEPAVRIMTFALLGIAAASLASILGHDPWTTRSALGLSGPFALGTSLVMGALLAGTTIALSRVFVRTHAWARALHADLRPAVRGTSGLGLLVLALASGIGEELVFRGLLVQVVGVAASSVAFGLLHQVRGRARWAWAVWAGCMGLAFAAIFVLTGSLGGAILAHVAVNLVNLRHLRDHDVAVDEPRARARLGGILSGALSARGTARPTASARAQGAPSARRA